MKIKQRRVKAARRGKGGRGEEFLEKEGAHRSIKYFLGPGRWFLAADRLVLTCGLQGMKREESYQYSG